MNKAQQNKRMVRAGNLLVKAAADFHRLCGMKPGGARHTAITMATAGGKTDYMISVDGLIVFQHNNRRPADAGKV